MDIKISDSWLRDNLKTNAKPEQIAKLLSSCGPSVEKIEKVGGDSVYHIEITTNRIDSASVYGIAREASAILPRFGMEAKLKPIRSESKDFTFNKNVSYLKAHVDSKLCPRFAAVLIKNVKIAKSPLKIQQRLEASGVRALNNVVDISNYIMLELGQPLHTFDYDKIVNSEMTLRQSKKGELIKTLDGKSFTLPGGDIVIEDGSGNLIDLAGIMGGYSSMVDENTKNVLLFVQTYNPENIRKTSMYLAQRTMAATIFEKGTDTELVGPAILKAIKLFEDLAGGVAEKNILNIYPNPYKTQTAKASQEFINQRLGIEIAKKDITSFLSSLGFECSWKNDQIMVKIPSFRSGDVKNAEDILEEIARIYGYHLLPSQIMEGSIPTMAEDPKFAFEINVKNIISGFGGVEVYTLSLVPQSYVDEKHLKLKNPLGPETEYLRTSLMPSIISAAMDNTGLKEKFHLFEIANVYIPKNGNLPEERLMLGGIFSGYDFRQAKGVIEGVCQRLNISPIFKTEESKGFAASSCAYVYHKQELIGKIGVPESGNFVYYEFAMDCLLRLYSKFIPVKSITKYPAQIEDITVVFPERTRIGEVINNISNVSHLISRVELKDVFKDSYTFRIWYQDSKKTLTNEDVEKIRHEIISSLKTKFGGTLKE